MTVFNRLEKTFDIGGSDCETCGWNPEDITVEADKDTRTWSVRASIGCYHGWYVDSTQDDALSILRGELKHTTSDTEITDEVLRLIAAAVAEWEAESPTN